jgi:hypothetical protein
MESMTQGLRERIVAAALRLSVEQGPSPRERMCGTEGAG